MIYKEAIELIRQNSYHLALVPTELIDLKMLRFVCKKNIWAAEAYCLKSFKKDWFYICAGKTVSFNFIDIDEDGFILEFEEWKK